MINFNQYFWTPYPFIILSLIVLIKGFVASRIIQKSIFVKQIVLTILISSVTSYVLEYLFSLVLNDGFNLLVWIPWVKVIERIVFFDYLISFPLIFIGTFLIESLVNWILLRKKYNWKVIIKTTFLLDMITIILLVITINFIAFNLIDGRKERMLIDELPAIMIEK